ncbi:hypothetical protein [Streptomyces sp. 150FB]|uniref:hypothetical protein n=1 Tax=Streptomyces sp. 150FB TaxID=1576605 RepID=UPI001F34E61E|nr:hypothetical protein [Streptomyces sp. 150FB]
MSPADRAWLGAIWSDWAGDRGAPVLRYTHRHIADTGRIVEVAHPIVRRDDTTVVDFVINLDD